MTNYNYPAYIKAIEQRAQFFAEQQRAVSSWRYKVLLIRHTKPNNQRKVVAARREYNWFNSRHNYESRLANRWPIRYFLTYTLQRRVLWPIMRLPRLLKKIKWNRKPLPIEYHFDCALLNVFGTTKPTDSMIEAAFGDPQQSTIKLACRWRTSVFPEYVARIRKLKAEIQPEPGHGTKSVFEYPQWAHISDSIETCEFVASVIQRATDILNSFTEQPND